MSSAVTAYVIVSAGPAGGCTAVPKEYTHRADEGLGLLPACVGQPAWNAGPSVLISAVEGSSTSGFLAEDMLAVGDGGPAANFVFGCAQSESGLLYSQIADGVFGMGRTPASLYGQVRPGACRGPG